MDMLTFRTRVWEELEVWRKACLFDRCSGHEEQVQHDSHYHEGKSEIKAVFSLSWVVVSKHKVGYQSADHAKEDGENEPPVASGPLWVHSFEMQLVMFRCF